MRVGVAPPQTWGRPRAGWVGDRRDFRAPRWDRTVVTTNVTEKAPRTAIVRLVRACARGAQRRPKTIIAAWLVFVIACIALGNMAGTRSLSDAEAGVGQSAQADQVLAKADLRDPAVENVLIQSKSASTTAAAVADLAVRAGGLPAVARVLTPRQQPALSVDGGRTELVQVTLSGSPDDAADNVDPLISAVRPCSKSELARRTRRSTTWLGRVWTRRR